MTAVRKFLFDLEFDDPEPLAPEDAETDAEETDAEAPEPVEETPPPPTFSEEEMEAARSEGFATGKQEGVREASAAMERQIGDTLNGIAAHLSELFDAEQKDITHLHALGVQMIRALAHKVLPHMSAEAGTAEIERLAANVLDRLRYEPHVLIAVNDELSAALESRMQAMAETKGFAGTVEVVADASVPPGDCRIEWSDGGAERRMSALMREIDAIVDRHLAGVLDPDELEEPEAPAEPALAFDPELEGEAEPVEPPAGDAPEAAPETEADAEAEIEAEAEVEAEALPDLAMGPDIDSPEDVVALDEALEMEDSIEEIDEAPDAAGVAEDTEELTPQAPDDGMEPSASDDGAQTPESDDGPPDEGSRQSE